MTLTIRPQFKVHTMIVRSSGWLHLYCRLDDVEIVRRKMMASIVVGKTVSVFLPAYTHARTHARMHARTHARTHALTHASFSGVAHCPPTLLRNCNRADGDDFAGVCSRLLCAFTREHRCDCNTSALHRLVCMYAYIKPTSLRDYIKTLHCQVLPGLHRGSVMLVDHAR